MYSKILMIGVLLGIILIGFIKVIYDAKRYVEEYNFVIDYSEKTLKLLNGNINDDEYVYLLGNIMKLSSAMGSYGVIDYKPPFANYIHKNYNVVNLIVNYQDIFMKDQLRLAIKTMHIYLGASDNQIDELKKKIKNPLILFAYGFRLIFNIPLFILNSLGIVSDRFYNKMKGNVIYYLIQNMFGLIGFVSSVIGIVQGKEVLMEFYNKGISYIASAF